jgi:hypothetical protein
MTFEPNFSLGNSQSLQGVDLVNIVEGGWLEFVFNKNCCQRGGIKSIVKVKDPTVSALYQPFPLNGISQTFQNFGMKCGIPYPSYRDKLMVHHTAPPPPKRKGQDELLLRFCDP